MVKMMWFIKVLADDEVAPDSYFEQVLHHNPNPDLPTSLQTYEYECDTHFPNFWTNDWTCFTGFLQTFYIPSIQGCQLSHFNQDDPYIGL